MCKPSKDPHRHERKLIVLLHPVAMVVEVSVHQVPLGSTLILKQGSGVHVIKPDNMIFPWWVVGVLDKIKISLTHSQVDL